jgi:hypothetical protein
MRTLPAIRDGPEVAYMLQVEVVDVEDEDRDGGHLPTIILRPDPGPDAARNEWAW